MTQDDVIKLAREAEFPVRGYYDENGATPAEIERLAALIEAKVKADLLAGAGEPVYWQYTSRLGNSYITEDRAAPSTDWTEVAVYTADQLAAAVLREREACAKACAPKPGFKYSPNYLGGITECANAIRARGNT